MVATLAVQKGDVAEAWRLSLVIAEKEDLRNKANEKDLTAEDFASSEAELNHRLLSTEAPPQDDKDLATCQDNKCANFKELIRLRSLLTDAKFASDDITVLESNLEINYRRTILSATEDQVRRDFDHRYIEVRGLLSSLKSDFGKSASSLQWVGECPQATKAECDSLDTQIATLRQQYTEAVEAGKETEASAILSEIHLNVALLELARDGLSDSSPEAVAIKRRYGLILAIIGRGGTDPGGTPQPNGIRLI